MNNAILMKVEIPCICEKSINLGDFGDFGVNSECLKNAANGHVGITTGIVPVK